MMVNAIRVYVAGPFTLPEPVQNTRRAMEVMHELMDLGHVPFVPHLSLFPDMIRQRDYEDWMRWCLSWVKTCDCLLRMPGESKGADREVELAESLGLPVFDAVGQLNIFYRGSMR